MKKLLAIILVLCLVLAFAACGSESNDDEFDDDIRGSQTVDGNDDDSKSDKSDEKEFELGKTSGLTYENKFIGIGCKLPAGWSFYDDDQLKELNNITAEYAEGDLKEALKDANIVYDMCAVASNGTDSINVNLEKVSNSVLKNLDIAENNEKLFPSLIESFEKMGYTDMELENGTIMIDGKKFVCMKSSGSIYGVEMHQVCVSVKCNGYLASISITVFGDTDIEDLVDRLYLID